MSQPRFCGKCGAPNLPENSFCAGCGNALPQQPAVQATPAWTPSSATQNRYDRQVSIRLVIGIIFVPIIFAWFTLRKGYSNTTRAVSFVWLVAITIISFAVPPQPTPRADQVSATATPSPSPTPTPELTSAEKLTRAKALSVENAAKEPLGQAVDLLKSIPKEAKEYKEARPLLDKTTKRWARLAAEDYLLGPKPENSGWNGKVFCVDQYLKETLNDYDDAEYLEWSPVTRVDLKGEPYWAVRLKLRAKNAFGAKILKEPIFFIRQNQVVSAVGL